MHGFLNISLEGIKSNWLALNDASEGKAAAVIKANSYGMGMIQIAQKLIEAGCSYFYVANLNEAINLRKRFASQKISIAVFEGFFEGSELIYFKNKLTPIINNLDQLKRINKFNIHKKQMSAILNIDTGMNRLGLSPLEIAHILKNKDILKVTTWDFIMSHLANSSNRKNIENYKQLIKIKKFSEGFPNIKLSLANTGGIKLGSKYCLDQTRPGIGLYGIDNEGKNLKIRSQILKLPLELYAPIIQIRDISFGQPVSYGGVETTKRKSKLATIGIGYADGWLRLLKTNSTFSVKKQNCKIIGNITMDSFILDITNINENSLKEGDYLRLLDNSNIDKILKNSDIISYELLTSIGQRIIRKYN